MSNSTKPNNNLIRTELQVSRGQCLVIGDPESGKSSLVHRVIHLTHDQLASVDQSESKSISDTFSHDSLQSMQSLSLIKSNQSLEPKLYVWECPDLPVELLLLDCGGRLVYEPWIHQLLRSSAADSWLVMAVFDLTKPQSLTGVRDRIQRLWPETCKSGKNVLSAASNIGKSQFTSNTNSRIVGALVGTRADQRHKRQIRSEEALQLARQLEFGYFECSVSEGIEAMHPFHFLADNLHRIETAKLA